MEQHLPEPPAYIEAVKKMNQAIFYCYNSSSERLPVSVINDFVFKNDQTLYFKTTHFPVTEMQWDCFAAELHFYKKGIAGNVILHGVAFIDDNETGTILFTIKNAEYSAGMEMTSDKSLLSTLFKPYIYFYRKSSELLMHPFKRKATTGVFQ